MNRSSKTILQLPFSYAKIRLHCRMLSGVAGEVAELASSNEANYPPCNELDLSLRSNYIQRKKAWHSKIEMLPTVEQKLIELNMPKYYGYYSVVLNDYTLNMNCLEFLKFATRTKVFNNLPMHYYSEQVPNLEDTIKLIKDPVEELIAVHYGYQIFRNYSRTAEVHKNRKINQNFIIDLNNLLMNSLNNNIPHLSNSSIDLRPRIEAFWFVGGFRPPSIIQKRLEGNPDTKYMADDPVDRSFRSNVFPTIALRTSNGLPEVVPIDENFEALELSGESEKALSTVAAAPEPSKPFSISPFETNPKAWGITSRRKHAVVIPGFWPGVKDEHGHIFLHSREHVVENESKFGSSFRSSFLEQRAIVNGFSQALSYALYQGFSTVTEMEYPIVQQSISTDGRNFQFGLYQLNTSRLHSQWSTENPRFNYLWLSEDMPLFESVEGDRVKGLNEDVLKLLCSMYLKRGQPRENPSPHLADYKYLMNHNAPEEYKEEFQKLVHHIQSERPRHRMRPEILPWEYIYKVKFKTRPRDRKTKFFENRWAMNPYQRRLDDYSLGYIPKVRRLDFKIKFKPRIHSELLFKHDFRTLQNKKVFSDDEIVYKTMNIDKSTPPYFNGLLWSRGMNKGKPKI